MDLSSATHNDYKVPIFVLMITAFILYFIILANWPQFLGNDSWKRIAYLVLSFVILKIMILYSYFRIKRPMLIDLLSLCEDTEETEDTVINIDNPIYITLSFLYYYIRIYIQAIFMFIIILTVFYIFFIFLNAQVERPIAYEFYKNNKYLYPVAGIEIIGELLFGGTENFKGTEKRKNGVLHFPVLKENSAPDQVFQILMPNMLYVHYVPFGIGCVSSIAYAFVMLRGSKEAICENKDAFIHKFRMGIVTVVTITILIYVMQCVKEVSAKMYSS
jgi:hypothetical protein